MIAFFRDSGGPFFATLVRIFGRHRGRKMEPFQGPDSGPRNGSIFRPLNVILNERQDRGPIFGTGIWLPKWVQFSDPELQKSRPGSPFLDHTNQSTPSHFDDTTPILTDYLPRWALQIRNPTTGPVGCNGTTKPLVVEVGQVQLGHIKKVGPCWCIPHRLLSPVAMAAHKPQNTSGGAALLVTLHLPLFWAPFSGPQNGARIQFQE